MFIGSHNEPINMHTLHDCLFWKDSFKLYRIVNGQEMLVPFDRKGIAWWTDYNVKYRNPASVNGSFTKAFAGIDPSYILTL